MPQARIDKFSHNIARSRRARNRRKQQRSSRRANGGISAIQEKSENIKDGLKSGSKEFGLLGLDIGKGIVRETASFGADFLITFSTLGLVEPASMGRGRTRRRRRRC